MNIFEHLKKTPEERRQIWEEAFASYGKARSEQDEEKPRQPKPQSPDLVTRMRKTTARQERLRQRRGS